MKKDMDPRDWLMLGREPFPPNNFKQHRGVSGLEFIREHAARHQKTEKFLFPKDLPNIDWRAIWYDISYNKALQESRLLWDNHDVTVQGHLVSVIGGTNPDLNTNGALHAFKQRPSSMEEASRSIPHVNKGTRHVVSADTFGRIDITHLDSDVKFIRTRITPEVVDGKVTGIRVAKGGDTRFVQMTPGKTVIISGVSNEAEAREPIHVEDTTISRPRPGHTKPLTVEATKVAVTGLGPAEMVLKVTQDGRIAFEKVSDNSSTAFTSARDVQHEQAKLVRAFIDFINQGGQKAKRFIDDRGYPKLPGHTAIETAFEGLDTEQTEILLNLYLRPTKRDTYRRGTTSEDKK